MFDTNGYDKMRAGQLYGAPDPYLIGLQIEAREKLDALNATPLSEMDRRNQLLDGALGSMGRGLILSPVFWEYGKHIHIGDNVFINFDCVFLDGADITIGDSTAIAPRVQFLTAGHPVDAAERNKYDENGRPFGAWCINKPITIGKDCWIGAGSIILGGVSIGDGTTIGAGSVVTRDIPAGVVAAGNPCRVIRKIESKPALRAANER